MASLVKVGVLFLGLLFLSVFPLTRTVAQEDASMDLFEARCSLCHETSKPLGETKTADDWRSTVTRMQQHAAGKISDEEREMIIEYLSQVRGK